MPPWIVPAQGIKPREATCPTLPSFMTATDRIIAGQDAPSPIPWQVSLQSPYYSGTHYCGGSILDHKTILTAAHCFDEPTMDYSKWKMRAGSTNKLYGGQLISISEVFNHPNYTLDGLRNDIAVIKLKESLTFGPDVQPACLPPGDLKLRHNEDCWTSGWGASDLSEES